MDRRIISRHEASKQLTVSKKTIDRLIRSGRIEAFKPYNSNRVLIYADSVSEENLQSFKPKFNNKL